MKLHNQEPANRCLYHTELEVENTSMVAVKTLAVM